jgi:hypothetical protein
MKLNPIYLILVLILLLNPAGGQLLFKMAVLLVGTAVPIQLAIYSVLGLRLFRPLRELISSLFAWLPLTLGFSLLIFLGVVAIVAEVVLLRDFVHPSDSWTMITLGFLVGIMVPVFRSLKQRRSRREQDETQRPPLATLSQASCVISPLTSRLNARSRFHEKVRPL